jgi:Nif-specific regulatory protein
MRFESPAHHGLGGWPEAEGLPKAAPPIPFPMEPTRAFPQDEAHASTAPASITDELRRRIATLELGLGIRRAALVVADPARATLSVEAAVGVDADAFRPLSGLGVAGRVAATGQPIVVPLVGQEPIALSELADPAAWQDEPLSLVSVPVSFEGRSVGALSVYFTRDVHVPFAAPLRALQEVAQRLAHRLATVNSPPAADLPRGARPHGAFDYANLIGASPAMRQVYEEIGQVAPTTATVLILGESGTGKELVAHAIHANSERAAGPFIKISGAALPDTLFESELFGHERGAFTGATGRKRGRLDLAQGGTLFLDEVGDLPLTTQVKLLRVLQSREYERLGGTETLKADVRLIAATNKNMAAAVAEGSFREDLYYRLNVFTIALAPLRERRADIAALSEYFLDKYAARHRRDVRRLASSAMDALSQYDWPGNVRELENAIERAVVVCSGTLLEDRHLPRSMRGGVHARPAGKPTLAAAVEQLERRLIEEALRESGGNLARASRSLGTTERILRYKVSKYGLRVLGERPRRRRP